MRKIWINPTNGQQIIAEESPGYMFSCLGEADEDWKATVMQRAGVDPNMADVDLNVPIDFMPEDDEF